MYQGPGGNKSKASPIPPPSFWTCITTISGDLTDQSQMIVVYASRTKSDLSYENYYKYWNVFLYTVKEYTTEIEAHCRSLQTAQARAGLGEALEIYCRRMPLQCSGVKLLSALRV